MKKFSLLVLAISSIALVSLAADLVKIGDPRTIGRWKDNDQAAYDIDKNFAALDVEAAGGTVTGVVAATTLTFTRSVNLPATNVVLTLQRGDVVYGEVTNSLLTNVTITVQYETVKPVTNATAATAITLTP